MTRTASLAAAATMALLVSCGRTPDRAEGRAGEAPAAEAPATEAPAAEAPAAEAPAAASVAATAPEERPAGVEDVAPPAQAPDPCERITRQYDKLISDPASSRCTSDSGCACYPGGIGKGGCGGVASTKAATKLRRLYDQYRAKGCSLTRDCGKTACRGACVEGECRDARLAPRPAP